MNNGKQPINPIFNSDGFASEFSPLDNLKTAAIGLTKREHFALHLMTALISNADRHSQEGDCQTWNYEHLSQISIQAADTLLKELSNGDGQ